MHSSLQPKHLFGVTSDPHQITKTAQSSGKVLFDESIVLEVLAAWLRRR